MSTQIVSGWTGRLQIGPAGAVPNEFFAFSEAEVEFESEDLNVTNSEGESASPQGTNALGYQSTSEGPGVMRLRVKQASFHVNYNPFVAPWLLVEGFYYAVRFYPMGTAGGYHQCLNMKVRRLKRMVETEKLSPFDAEFTSDGGYTRWSA